MAIELIVKFVVESIASALIVDSSSKIAKKAKAYFKKITKPFNKNKEKQIIKRVESNPKDKEAIEELTKIILNEAKRNAEYRKDLEKLEIEIKIKNTINIKGTFGGQNNTYKEVNTGGGDYVEGNKTVTNNDIETIFKAIEKRDLQNPVLRKFARAIGKNPDDYDNMAVFWEDLEKHLEGVKQSEERYKQIEQETVSEKLKALFNQIDKARAEFDYTKVDQLLDEFEEQNKDLINDLAKTFFLRADNFELQLKYNEAEKYYKKALALDDQNPIYLNAYGLLLHKLGQYDKAIEYYNNSLKISFKIFEEDYLGVAQIYNNLGGAYKSKGEYDKAIEYLEKAVKILEEDHPDVAVSYNNLGEVYRLKGEYDKAIEYLEKALKISLKT
ncbi:MAG: tetratricopeptide repeat protein, partial [Candidatus Aenigmarchaeota archaeon]|nr:tetratricopeptide repeat protein [Candidatus Aenigmarchaeota archaeon]